MRYKINLGLLLFFTQNIFGQEIGGRIDTSFQINIGANNAIFCLREQPDKKIIAAGSFSSYNGQSRNLIVRIQNDGNLDETFVPDQIGWGNEDAVYSIIDLDNGEILVGGDFTNVDGFADSGLKLLNPDGSQATNWYVNGKIYCMAKQPDGKIILGGQCYSYGATTVKRIFRINPDYSIDSTFNTMTDGANGGVYSIAIQPDGKILIGGNFQTYKGAIVNHFVRLNDDGEIDTTFHTGEGFDNGVTSIALQSDNKIILGGQFTSYNGTSVKFLARLNTNGTLDNTFNNGGSGMNDVSPRLFVLPNDQILLGATISFTNYNNIQVNHIARLNSNGSLDTNFDPLTGPNGSIHSFVLQDENKIVLGGFYTNYDNIACNNICRIFASSTTSFNEKNVAKSFTLSPNPASNYLRISYDGESKDFTIFNTMGVIVYAEKLKKGQATINTSPFPPGLYYVKVGDMVKKLVIE